MANRYWVGGTGGWNDSSHWSTTSGGAGGATVPGTTGLDDVYFDSNSSPGGASYTVQYDVLYQPRYCENLTISNPPSGTITFGTITSFGATYIQDFYLGKNLTISSGVNFYAQIISGRTSGTQTIDAAGATIYAFTKYSYSSVTVQLLSDFTCDTISMYTGTFDANDYNVTTKSIEFLQYPGDTTIGTLNMGSGTWELTGEATWCTFGTTGLTLNEETSTIKLAPTVTTTVEFNGSNNTYYNLWIAPVSTAPILILDDNTFNDIKVNPGATLKLQNASTQTVTTVDFNGTAGNLTTIKNNLGLTQAILNCIGSDINSTFADMTGIIGTPSNTWYFDINSVDSGNNTGLIFPSNPTIPSIIIPKTFEIKVYTVSDEYLTTWTDVISKVSFNNEINSAGGELRIMLGRNAGDYGEGTDVDFGNKVKIYCIDSENPDGILIYQGSISAYTPIYKDDNVEVTVLNIGAELSTSLLQEWVKTTGSFLTPVGSKIDGISPPAYLPLGSFGGDRENDTYYALSGVRFTPGASMTSIGLVKYCFIPNSVWNGSSDWTTLYDINCTIYPKLTSGARSGYPDYDNPLGSKTLIAGSLYESAVNSTVYGGFTPANAYYYEFIFDTLISVTPSTDYFIVFSSNDAGMPLYNLTEYGYYKLGYYWTNSGGGVLPDSSLRDYQYTVNSSGTTESVAANNQSVNPIEIYAGDGSTAVSYTNEDPSNILKDVIDKHRQQGGKLNYTNSTIDLTSTTVSYDFNTNTIFEAITKVLELCPQDWYWYIDYSTNLIHLKQKNNSPNHIFTLEKDLIDAKFEKRIEDVVNTIYFTGGEVSPGVNYYKKFIIQQSIDTYGIRAMKYTDNKVTTDAIAETIANAILETRSQPELRVTLEILDSNNDERLGYDLESIQVGDVVAVRNITQQVGLSTWDYGKWDEAYWDYNIYNLTSLQMQIQKIDYNEDRLTIDASTMAVDVNKRIEQINQQLEAIQTNNNPTTPS